MVFFVALQYNLITEGNGSYVFLYGSDKEKGTALVGGKEYE